MNNQALTFKSFSTKYSHHILIMAATLVVLMHGFLFSFNYRIDSIIKIISHVDEFNDIELGRFGIVYLNRLLGMQWYNPYLVAFLTLATIVITSIALAYLFWRLTEGKHGTVMFLVPFLIYLTPNWTEQLYFSYQTFLVLLGVLLVIVAVYLVLLWVYRMKHWMLVAASICLFVAFSVYQSFVPLYMALGIGCFLLECVTNRQKDLSYFARSLIGYAIAGGAGLVAYYIGDKLAKIGYPETDYLSKQFLWGSLPLNGVISNIILSLRSILTGQGVVDTMVFSLSMVASLVFIIVFLAKNKDVNMKGFIIAAWVGLQFSAVALIIALGVRTYIRTELSITFVIAINLLLCCVLAPHCFDKEKQRRAHQLWTGLAYAVTILGLLINSSITLRLYYTDDIRNEQDLALAQQLVEDLRKQTTAAEETKAVVFVGEPDLKLNEACLKSEVIGVSLFAYHDTLMDTNTIISNLLITQGVACKNPTDEELQIASDLALEMPNYPADGSIVETEDVIVVRFSSDPFYGTDYLQSGYTEVELTAQPMNEEHITQIDSLTCTDGVVTLKGFSIDRGVDSDTLHYQLLLVDLTSEAVYSANTSCAQRLRISRHYDDDDVNYDSCGFIAKFPLELLSSDEVTTCEIILQCTTDSGECYYIRTGMYINESMVTKNPKT